MKTALLILFAMAIGTLVQADPDLEGMQNFFCPEAPDNLDTYCPVFNTENCINLMTMSMTSEVTEDISALINNICQAIYDYCNENGSSSAPCEAVTALIAAL